MNPDDGSDWRSSAGIEFFGSIGGKTKSDVG